ncbi:MucR family transcriptional regulator [Devosia sp.]|uniref:MucR family transcriptional regulator n=1 Tax=Devosia sp. TaxID=1871048 RepID=UPI0025C34AEF|nr:MucR family transcriptional regulator [Devosia sp.]
MGLPADFPMVALNYSRARSELAKQTGWVGSVAKPRRRSVAERGAPLRRLEG